MKLKSTLILVLIAAALVAFIKFYESKQLSTRQRAERESKVVFFDRDDIDGITIKTGEQEIELRRREDGWFIESPAKDRADNTMVTQILNDAESLEKRGSIPATEVAAGKFNLQDMGLKKPKVRLKLSGKKAPPEIQFGKEAAFEGRIYAGLEGSKEIYIVDEALRNLLLKKPEEFRDHRLTDLNTTEISRVVIKNAAGEIELKRAGDQWKMVKPLQARADDHKVTDLIAQITTAQVHGFVSDDKPDVAVYGLAEPRGTVSLFPGEGGKPAVLEIGPEAKKEAEPKTADVGPSPAKEPESYIYGRLSTRRSILTLPKQIEDLLNIKPNELRDRHLVRINMDMVDRINIQAPGVEKLTLARDGEKWFIGTEKKLPANAREVDLLTSALQTEPIADFVSDVASDLVKYGLDQPQLTVGFSAFSSEGTPESPAGERPLVAVQFGKLEGELVYARVEDEPYVVSVSKDILNRIATDPLKWQELAIFNSKPGDIRAVEIQSGQQPAVILTRNEKDEWTAAKPGQTPPAVQLKAVVSTLESLRAVRWAGATRAEFGIGSPALTIKFNSGKGEEKLTLGNAAPDGMRYATADGKQGTFLISRPDSDSLFAVVAVPKPEATRTQEGRPQATPVGTPPGTPPGLTPAAPAPAPAAVAPPTEQASPVPSAPLVGDTQKPAAVATPKPTPPPPAVSSPKGEQPSQPEPVPATPAARNASDPEVNAFSKPLSPAPVGEPAR